MSLSKEISEFTSGFKDGWKLATPTAAEYAINKDREEKAGVAAAGDEAEAKVGAHAGRPYIPSPMSSTGGTGRRAGVLPASDEPIDKYAAAIKVNESSGNYGALGPVIKKKDGSSDQALGAYQVMASNLPSWSRKHLGREYTRDEFLKDQDAQDKLFRGEFGSYVQRYGNPQDAASMWFTGRPRAQGANARDVLGTSGSGYVKKFDTALASFAEGGRVPTDEEYARFMREAYAGSMDAEEAPVVESAAWTEPTVAAAPAGVLPVEVTGTLGPDQAVTAREPSTPLPPRRPSEAALRTAAPAPRPKPRGVLPTEPDNGAALPGEGMTAESDEPYDPRKVAHTAGVGDAIEAGLKSIGRMFGFSDDSAAIPAARPDRGQNVQRFHRNEGAATRQEIAQIDSTIDPDNKLSADARAVARLYGGYQYFLKKGEPAKAEKYAQSILMYTRSHMQMAGALATERLQAGDVGRAAKIIAEAHNEVPDGQTLQVGAPKNGKVPFKLIDEFGDLTEAGEANVNQLMHLATGMQNGSEWLSQIRGAQRSSLTAAQKMRLRQQEADAGAANDFMAGADGNNAFLSSMTDAQKDAYRRASPALKAQLEREFNARQAQERQETALADRQKKDEEKSEFYKRREQTQEKERVDQQEYAGHVASIKAAQADLDDQMATDPGDTAKVNELRQKVAEASRSAQQWTAGDAGRAKYVGMLRLETRPQRGAGGAGGAGGGRGGGTEAERKSARLDAAYTEAERAANREGAAPELKAQLPRLKADVEFRKRATDFDPEQLEEVDTRVAKQKGISDPTQLEPTERFAYHDAVSGLLRGGNDLGIDQAVALTQLAIKNGKVTILDDGRVKIGDARPVYISQEGLNALAILRQREKPAAGATTTRTNPFREPRPASPAELEDAADEAKRVEGRRAASAARNLRRKSGEFERIKSSLGDDYRDDMTLADMRKALRDRTARNARIEMETGGFQVRPLE